jgi:pilus assembly protein CpaB
MAARAVPVRFASSDRIPAEDAGALAGRRLAHAVRKGDALGWLQLESRDAKTLSARLEAGQRAITFPVDDVNSFSGLLTPGDSIDLLYSTRSDAHGAQVVTLLQAVRVLATGKLLRRRRVQDAAGHEREVAAEFVTVTLHVSPDAAARIVLAQQTGEITAVLRNDADQEALHFTRWDSRSLLVAPRTNSAPSITMAQPGNYMELILGGVGAGVAPTRRVPVLQLAAAASIASSEARK